MNGNNKEPLVSIIMPVYNCEKYLSEAIESVLGQTYSNWELLIIDDGSTDDTSKIVDNYAEINTKIKVYHRENKGVSQARNFGLEISKGELITFIDGDDIYLKDCLKQRVSLFQKYPDSDIVISRQIEFKGEFEEKLVYDENINVSVKSGKNLLQMIISDTNNHFSWNSMIKSQIAKSTTFPLIKFAEDYCYIRNCVYLSKKVVVSSQKLYFYRVDNQESMTNNFFAEKYIKDYMELPVNFFDFCMENNLKNTFYRGLIAHEYAQNSMRIRKCTSYSKFVKYMNDKRFRIGIEFAKVNTCTFFEKLLFYLVKYKIYFPFLFWIWK